MQNLTLVIPGLFGPDTLYSDDFAPTLESLELLLARADHTQNLSSSCYRSLCELIGLALDPGLDVPVAAITRVVDDNEDASGIWMRADPVHLRPDRDSLILMDSFVLRLSQHDALAIATEVNKVLADKGWIIEVPFEDRWYIRLDKIPDIRTVELPAVVSKNISACMPQGRDSAGLITLLNEIQMQLHECDINQLRESKGELPVNSVWFWGAGQMPGNFTANFTAVFSNDVFARGLALKGGLPCHPVPADIGAIIDASGKQDSALLLLQHCEAPAQYQNLRLWHEALLLLEQFWFKSALQALRKGRIQNLAIVSAGNTFVINRLGLKKFWRKNLPVGYFRES
jgi:hypothetical protein